MAFVDCELRLESPTAAPRRECLQFRVVPITPYLTGQSFETKAARNRAAVFEAVCSKLGLAACDRKATQTVAKTIIELEQPAYASDAARNDAESS
jgi:hypothetical protein